MKTLSDTYKLKEGSVKEPGTYLGADISFEAPGSKHQGKVARNKCFISWHTQRTVINQDGI